ncbi:MAG TPA: type III-B CRISPR module RAMP protein Cmr4, partial [Syntrophales bacterium]|nr:type III-B CRISPR module RAMP protein Cmr4 [Syntrophales bacterium]
HTNWPHIQASAVKGAMRAHYRDFAENTSLINYLFGSDEQDGWKEKENIPGAISVSDAKLLAFPVRSSVAPFVWVTCPAVLKRLDNDLTFAGMEGIAQELPAVAEEEAFCLAGNVLEEVLLEDMVVTVKQAIPNPVPAAFPPRDNLLLVSNEAFKYLVESCTEIQTQIKINSETGTAQDRALRYQELLPADSVLYSVVYYSRAVFDNTLQADTVRGRVEDVIKNFIQIGGDETLGRGICQITWLQGGVQ